MADLKQFLKDHVKTLETVAPDKKYKKHLGEGVKTMIEMMIEHEEQNKLAMQAVLDTVKSINNQSELLTHELRTVLKRQELGQTEVLKALSEVAASEQLELPIEESANKGS